MLSLVLYEVNQRAIKKGMNPLEFRPSPIIFGDYYRLYIIDELSLKEIFDCKLRVVQLRFGMHVI